MKLLRLLSPQVATWGLALLALQGGMCHAQSTLTQEAQILQLSPATSLAAPAAAPQPVAGTPPASQPSATAPQAGLPLASNVFGANIFTGAFSQQQFSGFNPDYQIAIGDRITLRMWGAFNHEFVHTVDAQGNIFIPNVGPVNVLGVRNGDLNVQVEARVKQVYRANVGVYATLEAAQPVKVYVTGYVRQPGLYGGLSSDSVLYYMDKAGGIDLDRGSFLDVSVLRNGKVRGRFNLYQFLLAGRIETLQLNDGDTIVVGPRKHTVLVTGEATNAYQFEFAEPRVSAARIIDLAKPKANATHLSIVRRQGASSRSEYYPLKEAGPIMVEDGDEINITSDKYPGTILVRVSGAHLGDRSLVLPYGAKLANALALLKPAPQANLRSLQLFRKSVATRQKEMLETSLKGLEAYVLTARSATAEEAVLRTKEAELVLQFVERARSIEPKGQILLAGKQGAQETLLEDGDTLYIPEKSSLVMVHGEVLFPNAIVYDTRSDVEDYIKQAGGYTQNADNSRLVVLHQDGSFGSDGEKIGPGDEIMVLPKVDAKNVEVARGISQIIYQIAVAAKVVFGL
ncbi:MAG: polysaccharide biosynthesis/export family protein [Thiobacillus sp.]|nr:polysaccharide biosynthesis/export family protein [Thiobacillus sp.]